MFLCLGINKNVFLCMIRNEYSYTMELKALIAECTAYDFKVMLEEKKPKSWLKSVSTFANGLGGSLFFGIDNDGGVKGLDDVQHVCETISSKIRDYMDPLPEVEMIPHDIEVLRRRFFCHARSCLENRRRGMFLDKFWGQCSFSLQPTFQAVGTFLWQNRRFRPTALLDKL